MSFNYSYYRSRCKILVVTDLPDDGVWRTIQEAAELWGVSKQTVRIWYLKGRLEIDGKYHKKRVVFHENRIKIDINN
jgi:hypothetical protein